MADESLLVPQVYGFQNINVIVEGVPLLDFAPGDDVVKCEFKEDQASDEVGADGNMMIVITADRSGIITVKLQQASRSNPYLMGLAIAQGAMLPTAGRLAIKMQDAMRQDIGQGTFGYLVKPADMVRGAKANAVEWKFRTQRLDMFLGLVTS